ncbi:MAG: Zn-ribbon domain-containing OB-fold protein [Pseudomonadota bacterium]
MSGIVIESCGGCGKVWYLPRDLCPHCGADRIERCEASGRGVVFSVTEVRRAPDEVWRALTPYRIALVDLEEGPRVMAHLDGEAGIGARVRGAVETRAERPVPVFRAE